MTRIQRVLPGDFDYRMYPQLETMAARTEGRMMAVDIAELIEDDKMQLWVIDRDGVTLAVVITEVIQYPRRKAFRFVGCVGEQWRDWAGLRFALRNYAEQEGCDLMEAMAFPKWRALLTDYRPGHMLFSRDI